MPTTPYAIDIEWPLSGTEVNMNFTASIKVRNEDDVAGPPAGNHYVRCKLFKGANEEDTGRSIDFDPDTEPLVSVTLNSVTDQNHKIVAELLPSAGGASITSDEESGVKVLATGGATSRPTKLVIVEI